MSLQTRIQDLATRIATEFRTVRVLLTGTSTGDLTGMTTTATNIKAAINELDAAIDAFSGAATTLDQLTDVTITTPVTGHILRRDGAGQFVNVDGNSFFQPLDSDLTAIAALATTAYGQGLLTLADSAALTGQVAAASETAAGKAEIATQTETNTGTDDVRYVTPLKFQTRLAAYAQPLDSDLTAIAALTTTAFGRGLLALADAAALTGQINVGTTAAAGKLLLASTAENQTGTDTAKASTPAGVKAAIDQRIDNNSALGASTVNAPSQAAVKAYADALIGANDAMVFKGVIDASLNPNYPASNRGDTYRISVAGKIGGASGPNVEVGDLLVALTDGTAAGTHATVGAQWNITQTNIDGAVTGPASSTNLNLASFNGTSGKVIQDSGFSADTDGTMAANSNTRFPTQAATRTYIGSVAQPLDTDLTAIAGLASAANTMPYATGPGAWALTSLTAFGRTLAGSTDAAAARTSLSVYSQAEIGNPETDFTATFTTALTA